MPELPEVETTRRGVEPHVIGREVVGITVRNRQLRKPVTRGLSGKLVGQVLHTVERRAKYLLFRFDAGILLVHLGMSGSLRVLAAEEPPGKHDHLDIMFRGGVILRYRDPRRFGMVLWYPGDEIELLAKLGPEPLSDSFDGDRLYQLSRGRKVAVKPFIMDNHVVVGVGNIYASEALYRAGIRPTTPAGRISANRYSRLAQAIREVLSEAIEQGGTTLRDFVGGDGQPGYFRISLAVYGRGGESCPGCGSVLKEVRLGQRSSVFCPKCQR